MIADLYEVPPEQAESEMGLLLEQLELTEAADDQIKGYSYGMQKKILLISVLVHHPQILFLDEPTSGLDPRSARTVRELLRERCEQGSTVFMTTHILEIAERICDRVGIISRGTTNCCRDPCGIATEKAGGPRTTRRCRSGWDGDT